MTLVRPAEPVPSACRSQLPLKIATLAAEIVPMQLKGWVDRHIPESYRLGDPDRLRRARVIVLFCAVFLWYVPVPIAQNASLGNWGLVSFYASLWITLFFIPKLLRHSLELTGNVFVALDVGAVTLLDLEAALFSDGISTKDEVSEVSGRGVGMGALKQICEGMGGRIEISSERGKGTSFKLSVPLHAAAAHTAAA